MGKFDRTKYANLGTKIEDQRNVDKELDKQLNKHDMSRAGYLTIDKDGSANVFRIYPPHLPEDGGGLTFSEARVVTFLPILQEREDASGQIIKEVKPKAIFNSIIHGNNVPKDLVDEYIKICLARANEAYPNAKNNQAQKEAKAKMLVPIFGSFNKIDPKKSTQGINYQSTWVVYADKHMPSGEKKFGRLELKKSIKDRLNALSATENSGQPLGVDPFTDIEDGRPIVIRYDKDATQAANYYIVDISKEYKVRTLPNGRQEKILTDHPLTDKQLEFWAEQEPLAKMFKNTFKKSDFLYQLEGLERHDKEHKIGIFQDSEFVEIIEELTAYFDSIEDEVNDVEGNQEYVEGGKVVESNDNSDDNDGDDYDNMNRKELIAEIKLRKMLIVVRPSMSEDVLRGFLREDDEASDMVQDNDNDSDERDEDDYQDDEGSVEEYNNDLPWDKEEKEAAQKKTSDRIKSLKKAATKKK